jgi:DNA-binding MarR family transcriptional regulator
MGKSQGASRPTERIGQLLFVATQAAQTLATGQLRPLGLSARGWGVLSTLAESGPLTQIELATTLAIDRTAMVYLLDELERDGLVERVRNPGDRRSFHIHLTDEGQRIQRKAATALADATDSLLHPLAPAERSQLRALLTRIIEHWQALTAAQP